MTILATLKVDGGDIFKVLDVPERVCNCFLPGQVFFFVVTSNVTLSISESTRGVFQASIEDEQRYSVGFLNCQAPLFNQIWIFVWVDT